MYTLLNIVIHTRPAQCTYRHTVPPRLHTHTCTPRHTRPTQLTRRHTNTHAEAQAQARAHTHTQAFLRFLCCQHHPMGNGVVGQVRHEKAWHSGWGFSSATFGALMHAGFHEKKEDVQKKGEGTASSSAILGNTAGRESGGSPSLLSRRVAANREGRWHPNRRHC